MANLAVLLMRSRPVRRRQVYSAPAPMVSMASRAPAVSLSVLGRRLAIFYWQQRQPVPARALHCWACQAAPSSVPLMSCPPSWMTPAERSVLVRFQSRGNLFMGLGLAATMARAEGEILAGLRVPLFLLSVCAFALILRGV